MPQGPRIRGSTLGDDRFSRGLEVFRSARQKRLSDGSSGRAHWNLNLRRVAVRAEGMSVFHRYSALAASVLHCSKVNSPVAGKQMKDIAARLLPLG